MDVYDLPEPGSSRRHIGECERSIDVMCNFCEHYLVPVSIKLIR